MTVYSVQIEELVKELKRSKVSDSIVANIECIFMRMTNELESVNNRLVWLEEEVDKSDIEDLFVRYQKKFDIDCWSGVPE